MCVCVLAEHEIKHLCTYTGFRKPLDTLTFCTLWLINDIFNGYSCLQCQSYWFLINYQSQSHRAQTGGKWHLYPFKFKSTTQSVQNTFWSHCLSALLTWFALTAVSVPTFPVTCFCSGSLLCSDTVIKWKWFHFGGGNAEVQELRHRHTLARHMATCQLKWKHLPAFYVHLGIDD